MEFTYYLMTPAAEWPADPAALAAAIRSQGAFQPAVAVAESRLQVRDPAHRLESSARLDAFVPETYEALLRSEGYTLRMTDRDRDTALPFVRQVTLTTTGPDGAAAATALFHATVADGVWWLLGGFLVDPYRRTIWGWRQWRQDQPLSGHAGAVAQAAMPAAGAGAADVFLYTLPYCPDCRDLRRFLNARGVPFQEVNLAKTPGAVVEMLGLNGGRRSAPTVRIGRQILVDPAPADLLRALAGR